MSHSHFECPVCDTPVQDDTIDQCHKCKWVFRIDKELNPDMQNELYQWARASYKLAAKSEKDEYNYKNINGRFDRQRDEIDTINNDVSVFKKILPQLLITIEEIKSILTTQEKTLAGDVNGLEIEIEEANANTIGQEQAELEKEEFASTQQKLTSAQQEIISDHYHNPREFAIKYQVKIANITKDSIDNNRGNEDKIVILEEASKGNYWIFDFDDYIYLVPIENKYINPHSYTTSSTIFKGHNYTPNYQKIQLIKPAIVSINPNSNPQTWRLQEQGELVFL